MKDGVTCSIPWLVETFLGTAPHGETCYWWFFWPQLLAGMLMPPDTAMGEPGRIVKLHKPSCNCVLRLTQNFCEIYPKQCYVDARILEYNSLKLYEQITRNSTMHVMFFLYSTVTCILKFPSTISISRYCSLTKDTWPVLFPYSSQSPQSLWNRES